VAKKEKNILHDLAQLPWWISVCVAVVVFVGLRYIVPSIETDSPLLKSFAGFCPHIAWIAIIFLFPAAHSALESVRKKKQLDRQDGIETIHSLSWKEFEELLAEAYRRDGYRVRENESAGPDGGVDIEIEKDGNLYLIQCKHWKSNKVGVKEVRELYGVVTKRKATGGVVVTSGMFTQEAKNFASDQPIDLIEGNQLVEMIRNVQKRRVEIKARNSSEDSKICPVCGKPLVLREAKRGRSAGSKFWGCSGFPECKYTKPYQ